MEPVAPAMRGDAPFHLGAFLAQWHGRVRHDLSASHSQTMTLAELLALATPAEASAWGQSAFDYGAPRGGPGLRSLIAARYHGLDLDDVICCAGAQEAMACVARALLGPGDHAVIVLPIYQPLECAVTDRAPATGVSLEGEGFTLDLARVAAALRPETRLILTNFPNSPTGANLDRATQMGLVDLCRARGLWLVNDEVYDQTVADPACELPPVAEIYERGVSINGLSKGLGLPGLRVGWAACRDRQLLARIATAKAMLSSCLAAPAEILGQIALREAPGLAARARAMGAANRTRLDGVLARHPALFAPDLAANLAFAFPRYRGTEGTGPFAGRLAAEAGTLVLPGGLWRSPLGAVPEDRFRISLGQPGVAGGLEAMDAALTVMLAA